MDLRFLLKVYVVVDIIFFLFSLLLAHPLRTGNVVINEIASNQNERSYIEIFSEKGFGYDVLAGLFFGILILMPTQKRGKKQKLRIVGAFDLNEIRESPTANTQFFVLGNPASEWIETTLPYYGFPAYSAQQSTQSKKIFGTLNEWLNLSDRDTKMIILTSSKTEKIDNYVLPPPPGTRQNYPYLEDNDQLLEYIRQNQKDIAIINGNNPNTPDRCILLNNLFPENYLENGRLVPYLPITEDTSGPQQRSWSKCGFQNRAFDHNSFKGTELTPGRSNIPQCGQSMPQNLSPEIPEGHEVEPHPCSLETCTFEDHDPFYRPPKDGCFHEIARGNSDPTFYNELQAICGSDAALKQNMAGLENKLAGNNAKRRKLYHRPGICPKDPYFAFKKDRERHIQKAMILINKFQSDKLDPNDFEDQSEWIHYDFDPTNEKESTWSCIFCTGNDCRVIEARQNNLAKGGVLKDSIEENRQAMLEHARKPTHKTCKQDKKERLWFQAIKNTQADILKNEPEEYVCTNRYMRLMFTICKKRISFENLKALVETSIKNGNYMGNYCRGNTVAKNMAKAISSVYFQELIQDILESGSPISILADGSEDNSGRHYVSVFFQYLNTAGNVQVSYYRLIPLGVRSSGQAYFDVVKAQLQSDGLWDHMKEKLTCITTDGAANMVSPTVGFSALLKNDLGRQDAVTHTCLAHKLELILDGVLKPNSNVFNNAKKLDYFLKQIYAFFNKSPKRIASLKRYCDRNGKDFFKVRRVMDIRWVQSHYHAGLVILANWDTLVGFLSNLESDIDWSANTESNKSTKSLAETLLKFLLQENFLMSLVVQLDLQFVFTLVSQLLQRSGQSVLGQYSKRQDLLDGIEKVSKNEGYFVKKFLSECLCDDVPCMTVQEFETVGNTVKWHDRQLKASVGTLPNEKNLDFEKVGKVDEGTMKSPLIKYTEFLKERVEAKMPSTVIMNTMSYLDNTKWPTDLRKLLSCDEFKAQLEKWPMLFGITYPAGTMIEQFERIVTFIEGNTDFWCSTHFSQPTDFWSLLLRKMKDLPDGSKLPDEFKNVLERSLVMPLSTADVERSFSVVKAIMSDDRSLFGSDSLDDALRICHHEDTLDTFDVNRATRKYFDMGHWRCDKEVVAPSAEPTIPPPIDEDDESCLAIVDENERLPVDAAAGFANDHFDYFLPQLHTKPREECYAIISRPSGKALTVYGNEVGLKTLTQPSWENQLWYNYGKFIVSNDQLKVLQRGTNGEPVILAAFDADNQAQEWRLATNFLSLEYEIGSLDLKEKLKAVGGSNVVDGTRVITSRKRNENSQIWSIEKFSSNVGALPVIPSNTPSTTSTTTESISSTSSLSENNGQMVSSTPSSSIDTLSCNVETSTRNSDNVVLTFTNKWSEELLTVLNDEIVEMDFLEPEDRKDYGKGLVNGGSDCWWACDEEQGPCEWCGQNGMCCRQGSAWVGNRCDGNIGGLNRHECVSLDGNAYSTVCQQWFKKGPHIFTLDGTGRVLQVGEKDEAVTLEKLDPTEIRQQWYFEWLSDGWSSNEYAFITSAFNQLRVAQIEDTMFRRSAKVGASTKDDPYHESANTQKWTINVVAPDQRIKK